MNSRPIGVFDSGIGGLTVFREIARLLPQEQLLYFGDTARLPYGNKSPEAIARYSLECASFLCNQGIKLLLIACHTASTHALEYLQEKLSIPILGINQSGLHLLVQSHCKRIAILGTAATISSHFYQTQMRTLSPHAQLFPIACPLFVPLVEEHLFDHVATQLIAQHYLEPFQREQLDAALLACTHYPLLQNCIQHILGSGVQVLNPASHMAHEARQLLMERNLLSAQAKPSSHFFSTDHLSRFTSLSEQFLGKTVDASQLSLVQF